MTTQTEARALAPDPRRVARSLLGRRGLGLLLASLVLAGGLSLATAGAFLLRSNLGELGEQAGQTMTLAAGLLLVMVAGEIDLSLGSLAGLAGGFAAMALTWWHLGPAPAAGLALLLGLLLGLLQGYWVAYRAVPSYVVTLGGLVAFRGVLTGLTHGRPIVAADPVFASLGHGWVAVSAWTGAIVLIVGFIANRTAIGRQVYALGSRREVARLAGVPIERRQMMVFGLSGLSAGVIGLLLTTRFGVATVNAGTLLELDALTACALGGARLAGGTGTVGDVIAGALFVALVGSGMTLLGLDAGWQALAKGGLLVLAVWLNGTRGQ